MRLVIRFTDANSVWSPSNLAHLQTRALANIVPIAAVSSTAWAYRVVPRPGHDVDQVVSELRSRPEVAHVDVDSKVRNP